LHEPGGGKAYAKNHAACQTAEIGHGSPRAEDHMHSARPIQVSAQAGLQDYQT